MSIMATALRRCSLPMPTCSMRHRTSIHAIPALERRGARNRQQHNQCAAAPWLRQRRICAAWSDTILPELDRFAPGLLIVSAGFDAHKADPLAQLRVETADYVWITRELMRVAETHCSGRLVSVLEGGYDLEALAASAAAHVRTLMDN